MAYVSSFHTFEMGIIVSICSLRNRGSEGVDDFPEGGKSGVKWQNQCQSHTSLPPKCCVARRLHELCTAGVGPPWHNCYVSVCVSGRW